MDSEISVVHSPSTQDGLGCNDINFPDRLLRIEIICGPLDSSSHAEGCKVIRVKDVPISSPILAAKSPFFYKLFSNGMKESKQSHVALGIYESEEAAFMELLKFMHSDVVSVDTTPALLDVLIVADKFEVITCISICCQLLQNLPMTAEFALRYFQLPLGVLMSNSVQPLINAAKQFLATHFTKYHEEVLFLPLAAIEGILSSDDLQAESEDEVYEFLLKWARLHYPSLEERRQILGSCLATLIRFPFMTSWKLGMVLTCPDLESGIASTLVQETLFFKGRGVQNSQATLNRHYVERAYKCKLVRVLEPALPNQECIVIMDLKREECAGLYPSGRIESQPFYLGSRRFSLSARCNMNKENSSECFGLFLGIHDQRPAGSILTCEFSARSKPFGKFEDNYLLGLAWYETFTGYEGCRDLLLMPWMSFIGDDSQYFIDDVLRLQAKVTLRLRQ